MFLTHCVKYGELAHMTVYDKQCLNIPDKSLVENIIMTYNTKRICINFQFMAKYYITTISNYKCFNTEHLIP